LAVEACLGGQDSFAVQIGIKFMKRSSLGVLAIAALGAMVSSCSNASSVSSFSPATTGGQFRDAHGVRPAQAYQTLYSFLGGSDGAAPQGGLINGQYGTTLYGGGSGCGGGGCGTVYNYNRTGNTESILYSFAGGSDGKRPAARLLYENGVYYGTTTAGGGSGCGGAGCGVIFAITQSGSETILHSFAGGSDGANPTSRLDDVGGTFYGTTTLGGSGCGGQGCGTVYSVTPSGSSYSVLHRFTGHSDGAHPRGSLIDKAGVLYGTTTRGGGSGCGGPGCGTIYRMTTGGSETVMHDFRGGLSDGAYPDDGLVLSNGILYGTTQIGGPKSVGTLYSITTSGTYGVVYSFVGGPNDGANPTSVVLAYNSTLYGTTQRGGSSDQGTLYGYTPGTTPVESVLHSFTGGSDGAFPYSGVIQVQGTLYGTTTEGGVYGCYGYGGYGCGTLYSLTP
jgi:uncharacterized repeat protein (TIGR03803 family)